MPLREWFEQHGHPGWYSWLVVVGSAFTSTTLAVFLAFGLVNAERERREQDRAALCDVIILYDDARQGAPPVTEYGRKLADAFSGLRTKYNCDGK